MPFDPLRPRRPLAPRRSDQHGDLPARIETQRLAFASIDGGPELNAYDAISSQVLSEIYGFPGVYRIRNTRTARLYIGSSKNIAARLWNHLALLRGEKHWNRDLQYDWFHLGDSLFTFGVIEKVQDVLDLADREEHYIGLFRATKYGNYNFEQVSTRPGPNRYDAHAQAVEDAFTRMCADHVPMIVDRRHKLAVLRLRRHIYRIIGRDVYPPNVYSPSEYEAFKQRVRQQALESVVALMRPDWNASENSWTIERLSRVVEKYNRRKDASERHAMNAAAHKYYEETLG